MRAILFNLYAYQDEYSYNVFFLSAAKAYKKGKILFLSVIILVFIIMMFVMCFAEQNELSQKQSLYSKSQIWQVAQAVNYENSDTINSQSGIQEITASKVSERVVFSKGNPTKAERNTYYLKPPQLFFTRSLVLRNTSTYIYKKGLPKWLLISKGISDDGLITLKMLAPQASTPTILEADSNSYHIRC